MGDFFERVSNWGIILFFALFGGAARMSIFPPRDRSLARFVGATVIAAFAGTISYKLGTAFGCSPHLSAAMAGVAGLVGDDLCRALIAVGEMLRKDPLGTVSKIKRGGDSE